MTEFEQFLISTGYIKYIFNGKKGDYELAQSHHISTITNIDYRYIKNNDFNNPIIFGLHVNKKPPTLIYPRPNMVLINANGIHDYTIRRFSDDYMNRILRDNPPHEVYNALFDKTKIYKFNTE